jgi:hypothetical protein
MTTQSDVEAADDLRMFVYDCTGIMLSMTGIVERFACHRIAERASTDALIARFQDTLHGSDYDTIERLRDYLKRNLESEGE